MRRLPLSVTLSMAAIVLAGAAVWPVIRTPAAPAASASVVNDVSQLNPIQVSGSAAPTTTAEIVDIVKNHAGPISIGGARHSMGGQIATTGAFFIDTRQFNRIVAYSPEA